MTITEAVNAYYYTMALGELRLMNHSLMDSEQNYNTLRYLDMIDMTENCTVTKLAELLHISKPAVTIKINEMLQQGLVVKRQSREDKRVNFLELDAATAKVYRMYDDRLEKAVEKIEKRYTKKERESFCEILSELSAAISFEEELT